MELAPPGMHSWQVHDPSRRNKGPYIRARFAGLFDLERATPYSVEDRLSRPVMQNALASISSSYNCALVACVAAEQRSERHGETLPLLGAKAGAVSAIFYTPSSTSTMDFPAN
jgi:hypothetical protein